VKNCIACNEQLEDDARFCSECRAKQPESVLAEQENLPAEESPKPEKAKPEAVLFVLPPDNTIKVDSAAISFEGKYFAMKNGDELKIVDTSSWEIIHSLHEGGGNVTSVSPDGNYIVISQGSSQGSQINFRRVQETRSARILNLQTGETEDLGTCTHPGSFTYGDGKIVEKLRSLSEQLGSVDYISFSPDSRYIVSGREASIWDTRDGSYLFDLGGKDRYFTGICSASFSHDGKRIVTIEYDISIVVWDAKNGNELGSYNLPRKSRYKSVISLSPDDKSIVVAYCDSIPAGEGRINIMDTTRNGQSNKLNGPEGIEWVSFTPDGQRLVSYDGSHVKIWDL